MEPVSLRVPGADGVPLHLLEWSREGVALLLVHGFGNEAHVWDDFAPLVAPYYRTLALDLRGHGDSGHDPERRYDYDTQVRDLEAVCEALALERLVLVAHSLGGRIATLFAGLHPERMAGLVIVDSGPELDPRGTLRIRLDVQKQGEPTFEDPSGFERMLAVAYPAARPEALRRMARHGLRRRADGRYERKMDPAFTSGRAGMSEAELEASERETTRRLWEALARISCPTLVVRGAASDVLAAETADRMVEEVLPRGRLAVVPAASHSVTIDNPQGFAEAVSAFVLGE